MCGQPCCPAPLPSRKGAPESISKRIGSSTNLDLVMGRDIRATIENRIPIVQHVARLSVERARGTEGKWQNEGFHLIPKFIN